MLIVHINLLFILLIFFFSEQATSSPLHISSGFILTNKMNEVKSGKHYSSSFLAFQKWIIANDNSACESTDKQIQWSPRADILNHLAFWNIGNEIETCLIFSLEER